MWQQPNNNGEDDDDDSPLQLTSRSLLHEFEICKHEKWWRSEDWMDTFNVRIRNRRTMKQRLRYLAGLPADCSELAEILKSNDDPVSIHSCQLCAEILNTPDGGSNSKPIPPAKLEQQPEQQQQFARRLTTTKMWSNFSSKFSALKSTSGGAGLDKHETGNRNTCSTCCLVICVNCTRYTNVPHFTDATADDTEIQACRCCLPLVIAVARDIMVEREPSRHSKNGHFANTLWYQNNRFQELLRILRNCEKTMAKWKVGKSAKRLSITRNASLPSNLSSQAKQKAKDKQIDDAFKDLNLIENKETPRRRVLILSKIWYDVTEALNELCAMIPSKNNPKSNSQFWRASSNSDLQIVENFGQVLRLCHEHFQTMVVAPLSEDSAIVLKRIEKRYVDKEACSAAFCLIRQLYLEYETCRTMIPDEISDDHKRKLKIMSTNLAALEQTAEVEWMRQLYSESLDISTAAVGRLVQERARTQSVLTSFFSGKATTEHACKNLFHLTSIVLKIIQKQVENFSTENGNQLLKAKLIVTLEKCV